MVETWFAETWPTLTWQEARSRDLSHARELTLLWNESHCWTVRLDQGFGYWGAAPHTRPEFPFGREVNHQVARMRQANLMIEPLNSDYPTGWYCGCLAK